jgi:hypothetical protein
VRYINVTEFLTEDEIQLAARMWTENQKNYAMRVCERLLRPNIRRINAALGQENDPMFLACAIEFVLTESTGRKQ